MAVIQQYAESGTEHFLPYAKKKLVELHDYMARSGLGAFSKRIDVSDGSAIYLNSLALGDGRFTDKVRITGRTGIGVWFGQFALAAEVNSIAEFPSGITTATATLAGPGGISTVTGTATSPASPTGAVYTNFPQWNNGPGDSAILFPDGGNIVNGPIASTTMTPFQNTSLWTAAAAFDLTTVSSQTKWASYLTAIINPFAQQGVVTTFCDALVLSTPVQQAAELVLGATPSPILPNSTLMLTQLSITLFAPAGNGNTLGIFGDPTGGTGTQVLGTAVFLYDPVTFVFTFFSWKATTAGLITARPPADLLPLAGGGPNAVIQWKGASQEAYPFISDKARALAYKTFATAVLAAT